MFLNRSDNIRSHLRNRSPEANKTTAFAVQKPRTSEVADARAAADSARADAVAFACFLGRGVALPRGPLGGAKAHTVEFERVRLQSVVRRLRTIGFKLTLSNSVMCAFVPPELTCTSTQGE